jgi:hypothetical protein
MKYPALFAMNTPYRFVNFFVSKRFDKVERDTLDSQ